MGAPAAGRVHSARAVCVRPRPCLVRVDSADNRLLYWPFAQGLTKPA